MSKHITLTHLEYVRIQVVICSLRYHLSWTKYFFYFFFLNTVWASLSPFLSSGQGLCVECEALWSFRLYQSVSFPLSIFIGF